MQVQNMPPLKTALNSAQNVNLSHQFQKTNDHKRLQKEVRDSFLQRISFCSFQYDLNDHNKHQKEKQKRLRYIEELSELLNEPTSVQSLFIPHLDLIFEMIEKNIFRPLLILKNNEAIAEPGVENEYVFQNHEWVHIQPILNLFLKIIENQNIEANMLKVFITHSFVQDYIQLFYSEEQRERELLQIILHRLYSKIIKRRKLIRKVMNEIFFTLIHENYKFAGAIELLQLIACIIAGFNIPLREENTIFFRNIIIPLHKVQTCQLYHYELKRCSMLFLSKDRALTFPILEGIIRYWPFANSSKEIIFLEEILEIFDECEQMDIEQFENIVQKLLKLIVKCISSSHLQTADRTVNFFSNQFFLNLIRKYKAKAFPLLVPVISNLADNYWNRILKSSFSSIKTILLEIDKQAYENCLNQKTEPFFTQVTDKTKLRELNNKKWEKLLEKAKQNNPSFQDPVVPYLNTQIFGENNGLNNKYVVNL